MALPLTLADRLLAALSAAGRAPCLEEPAATHGYADLLDLAARLASTWDRLDPGGAPVAVLCDHSLLGFASVVAAVVTGRTFVPLHPALPFGRISATLRAAGCRLGVVDAGRIAELGQVFAASGVSIVVPCDDHPAALRARPESDRAAYVLFTSGSTGAAKGVVVGPAALDAYCQAAASLFPVLPGDRCTQLFDLSFDLALHDILCTFLAGACLVVDRERQRIDPVGFAASARASVWFSVPSTLALAKRFRRLRTGALPDLRLALFCGEALPVPLARDFLAVAPRAEAFNLYGPTEATIAITSFRIDRAGLAELTEPWVPIGQPFPGSACLVVDEDGNPAAEGEEGELWLAGPQLAAGYLAAPEATARQFVAARFAGRSAGRWYRSGDRARLSAAHGLLFCGRQDQQVKIGGHRVELGEVENVLLATGLVGEAAAFARAGADGSAVLLAAIAGPLAPAGRIVAALRAELPPYMVPSRLLVLDGLPRSAHGKIDRRALAMLDSAMPAATR